MIVVIKSLCVLGRKSAYQSCERHPLSSHSTNPATRPTHDQTSPSGTDRSHHRAYYEVYNHTSSTYPEYIYERVMMEELRRRGMATTSQDEYQFFYKERLVGVQRLDMFVVQEVVVENKVAEHLTPLH